MENLEKMAELAVLQGYLDRRMKELKARMDSGESPEPLREEFRKCLEESQRIGERLAFHYRSKENKLRTLKAKHVKAVKEAAKENAGL
jgi:hypothetical protein